MRPRTAGDVQVSIVPFSKLVNVGTGQCQRQLDRLDGLAGGAPQSVFLAFRDSGHDRPGRFLSWNTTNDGFRCVRSPTSTSTTNTIPTSSPNTGLICPSAIQTYTSSGSLAGKGGHHFNGCYTSVDAGTKTTVSSGWGASCGSYNNCSCSGSGSSNVCKATNYNHVWTVNATSTWAGCIMDRTQDYDTNVTTPSGAEPLSRGQ